MEGGARIGKRNFECRKKPAKGHDLTYHGPQKAAPLCRRPIVILRSRCRSGTPQQTNVPTSAAPLTLKSDLFVRFESICSGRIS